MNSPDNPNPFPVGTRQAWEQAAREELQGADPWQKLTHEVQGVSVRPYYSKEDTPPGTAFRLPASDAGFLGPRTWYNCPRVIVINEVDGNAEALEHLRQGADGIFFELRGAVDFEKLLAQVEWPLCTLHFLAGDDAEASAKSLANYQNRLKGPIRGAWYGKGSAEFRTDLAFHPVGHSIPTTSTPAETMAEHLGQVLAGLGKTSKPVALRLETGTDFFLEIAKLRALRHAWNQMTGNKTPLHIHTCSPPWSPEAYEPHANLLKATTAAMSAILGGADSITIDPETTDHAMKRRVARNVAILLREESRFAKVADPLAGAYFIDSLTQQLSGRITGHRSA